jgi:hypothetical protein
MRIPTNFLITLCIISTSIAVVLGVAVYYLVDYYTDTIDVLENLNNYWIRAFENLNSYWEEVVENLARRPYLENRDVIMSFLRSNGTWHSWSVPLDAVVSQAYLGWYKKETGDFEYVDLRDNKTGELHRLIDFRPFIIENNFENVMTNLYHDLGNNDQAFVHEVWYIVTQLTIYQSEIEETPRFPLDTFAGGGGDCEDLAILIASMLKAAPADYTIKLVYMDADNPTDPTEVNHVIVWVETPNGYKTFVDGTSHTEMCLFTEVVGWYFEV